jgi:UDP-glucose 4-epimerase
MEKIEFMQQKKVLVIGGNGFIGRNLCRHLCDAGYSVTSFDILNPEVRTAGVHYVSGDFFDDDYLMDAIREQDVIVHALSTVNPGNSNKRYLQGYERDFVQTVKLCAWLSAMKQKMVFISSGGTVYGEQKEQPIKETALTLPRNHYGAVKLCIENVIRTFNIQSGAKHIIARVANPYGPGQDYTKGVGFVDAALKKTLAGETLEIWGDGSIIRDYIHIDDVCKMLLCLIEYEGEYDVFNVSSGVGISQNDIVEHLKKLSLAVTVNYADVRSVDVAQIVLDNSRISSIYPDALLSFYEGLVSYKQYLSNRQATE